MDIDISELQRAIEQMHHCSARFVQAVPVTEKFEGKTVAVLPVPRQHALATAHVITQLKIWGIIYLIPLRLSRSLRRIEAPNA